MNELLRLKKYQNLLDSKTLWHEPTIIQLKLKLENCLTLEKQYIEIFNDNFQKLQNKLEFDLAQANGIKEKFNQELDNLGYSYSAEVNLNRKIPRIAVLLVGHYRTFPRCVSSITKFFSSMAEQTDYFFATWNESSHINTCPPVYPIFAIDHFRHIKCALGQLLKDSVVVDSKEFEHYHNNELIKMHGLYRVINLSYLSLKAQQLKYNYEQQNNFVYDQVIEIRPDTLIETVDWQTQTSIKHICKAADVLLGFRNDPTKGFFMNNFYLRTNSDTNNMLSNRYEFFIDFYKNIKETDQLKFTNNYNFHHILDLYFQKTNYNLIPQADAAILNLI